MAAYGVILFPSTHSALRAEKLTIEQGIAIRLIPIPRHLSSDCGVCLRFLWEEKEKISRLLTEGGVKIEGIYLLSC